MWRPSRRYDWKWCGCWLQYTYSATLGTWIYSSIFSVQELLRMRGGVEHDTPYSHSSHPSSLWEWLFHAAFAFCSFLLQIYIYQNMNWCHRSATIQRVGCGWLRAKDSKVLIEKLIWRKLEEICCVYSFIPRVYDLIFSTPFVCLLMSHQHPHRAPTACFGVFCQPPLSNNHQLLNFSVSGLHDSLAFATRHHIGQLILFTGIAWCYGPLLWLHLMYLFAEIGQSAIFKEILSESNQVLPLRDT